MKGRCCPFVKPGVEKLSFCLFSDPVWMAIHLIMSSCPNCWFNDLVDTIDTNGSIQFNPYIYICIIIYIICLTVEHIYIYKTLYYNAYIYTIYIYTVWKVYDFYHSHKSSIARGGACGPLWWEWSWSARYWVHWVLRAGWETHRRRQGIHYRGDKNGIPSGYDIHSLPWKDPPMLLTGKSNYKWAIGWWENWMMGKFTGKNHGFRCRFSLKPIHWILESLFLGIWYEIIHG